MLEVAVADHAFLGGRLLLREPMRGHRSGTDAVLLAMAAPLRPGQHLVDVGAGAGAAALSVLCRVPGSTATLVECDPAMAMLARHNIAANGFGDRADVVEADVAHLSVQDGLGGRRGDVVISNPPFYLAGTIRPSTVPQRVRSHMLEGMSHGDWVAHMLRLAMPRGQAVIIHRPDALPALLATLVGRAGVRLRAVHGREAEPATRMLLSLSIGRRSPFTIEAALTLHKADGKFTTIADALHRGEGNL